MKRVSAKVLYISGLSLKVLNAILFGLSEEALTELKKKKPQLLFDVKPCHFPGEEICTSQETLFE